MTIPDATATMPRGRPRSKTARDAVLHAADDLLVELGYDALTMKGIAERAGVGRQTVYRWWTSKADILFEACTLDAARELALDPADSAISTLAFYLERLLVFLNDSDAGATYLALLGASRIDPAVAAQLSAADPLRDSARSLVERLRKTARSLPDSETAIAQVIGPFVYQALSLSGPIPREFLGAQLRALNTAWSL